MKHKYHTYTDKTGVKQGAMSSQKIPHGSCIHIRGQTKTALHWASIRDIQMRADISFDILTRATLLPL